ALVALLAAQAPGEGPLGRLVRVRADDVDVRFRDNFTGQFWRLTDAEIEVTREADRDVGHLSGRVAPPPRAVGALADPGGEPERWAADDDPYAAAPALPVTLDPPDPGGPPPSTEAPRMARFSVEGERAHGDGEIGVRVRLGGLPIAHLALAAGAPESEAATFGDLRAGVRGEARLAGDGRLLSFRGGARVGRGTLVGVPEPFGRIERVVLGLDMDAARPGRVDVRRLRLLGGAGRLEATGEISRWPSGEGLSLALDIDEVEVRPEAGFSEAQIYDDGRLTAHFLPRAGRIELETLQLESAGATLSAQGAAQWDAAGPEVAIGFATGPMSLDALLAGWPLEAGPGARRWVAAHLSEQPVAAPGEDGDPAPIPTS
ncbi:MAG: hypothetical protein VX463_18985, partial [Pseudomonadota bacterium]|nr:hypothetical protein [Pseudomonadota bacterium]